MTTDAAFWREKRVLVTGHTGFKGSWLCLWLASMRARVTGYALEPPTTPSLFELASVVDGMDSVIGDVRDLDRLAAALDRCAPEIVFHLAAQPLVRRSYDDPIETYSTNIMGTINVFEAVRRHGGVKVLVNVTSDKCYENRESNRGYAEEDRMGGYDPYSNSKGCAELVTTAYRRSFFSGIDGTVLASARAGNVIGGGDWGNDRLLPDILAAVCNGRPAMIRYPNAIRPWQHVLEPLGGYLLLAETLWREGQPFAQGWNFGPDERDCCTVAELVDRLIALWGEGASWQTDDSDNPHEAGFLKLDCALARNRLGWRTRWNLDRGLEAVVTWHKALGAGEDVKALSLRQIEEFIASPTIRSAA